MARQLGYKVETQRRANLILNKHSWYITINSVDKHLNTKVILPEKGLPPALRKVKGKLQYLKFVRTKKKMYKAGGIDTYDYEFKENLSQV